MSARRRAIAGSLAASVAVLLVAGGFVLALLGAHVDPPGYRTTAIPTATAAAQTAVPTAAPPHPDGGSDDSPSRPLHEVGDLVLWMYIAFVVGAVLAVAVLLLRALAGAGGRRRREPPEETDPRGYDLQPDLVAQRMADAATASLAELAAEGPVADVIIACWQRLRGAAADAGVAAVPSDTPEEAIARVLGAGAVSEGARGPLATLAGLYREARFSEHEMSRGDVWVARQALQTIVAQLRPEASDVR